MKQEIETPAQEEKSESNTGTDEEKNIVDDDFALETEEAREENENEMVDIDTTADKGGEHDSELPTVSPTAPVDNTKRTQAHHKLRCYESRRRKAYGSKLSSSSLYWRSFRELMNNSLKETIRAERIVHAHQIATENYANHIKAAHEDMLDDDFKPVVDARRKKKLLAAKKKEEQEEKQNTAAGFKLGDMKKLDQAEGLGKGGQLLNSMIESQSVLADRYQECAAALKDQVATEVSSLRKQLQTQVTNMETLGEAILNQLEAAENEVVQAWEEYYNEAQKTMNKGGASDFEIINKRRRGATEDGEREALKDCSDLWINEMHYRMAVAFLSSTWEKCSAELSRLFNSMKETECSRRHRLRELLVVFLQKEERLWTSLPSIISPVLKEIVDRTLDRAAIEEDVQYSIRMRAQGIQREEASEMKNMTSGPGLAPDLVKDGNFELSSPLVSDQLWMTKVMETKSAGMMRSWKTVLAVTTTDSFLHLFELPSSLRVQSGSAAEVAFNALVPTVEIPTEKNMKAIVHPRTWNDNLSPSDSVVLPNVKIQFTDDGNNSAFEITETVFNQGAGKLFGKSSVRKMMFRTRTYEETKKWIEALKAPK